MPRKKKHTISKAFNIVEASALLGITPDELELALDMLKEVNKKMDEWEKTNGLRKEKQGS